MEAGEEYITIKLIGHSDMVAFPNKEGREKNPQAPHYKNGSLAVWINKKKEPKTENIQQ